MTNVKARWHSEDERWDLLFTKDGRNRGIRLAAGVTEATVNQARYAVAKALGEPKARPGGGEYEDGAEATTPNILYAEPWSDLRKQMRETYEEALKRAGFPEATREKMTSAFMDGWSNATHHLIEMGLVKLMSSPQPELALDGDGN